MDIKKYNKDDTLSYTIGAFPTYEMLTKKPQKAKLILLHEKCEKSDDVNKILDLAQKHNIPISTNSKLVEKVSEKGNVYIVGVFEKYDMILDNTQNQVCLVEPSDMGNLGTIIRVMLGFGYHNLAIIKPCIDIFNPKVIRASMGAIFSINVQLFDSFSDYLKINKNQKYPFMLQTNNTLQKLNEKLSPHTLIFGNEAHGLNDTYLNVGTPVRIEHSHDIDSLNLSMSVGIALYEFTKK